MKKLLTLLPYFLLSCFILGYLFTSTPKDDLQSKYGYGWESYDSRLAARIEKVDDIIYYADSALGKENRRSLAYAELLNHIVSNRFYHGFSYYSFRDNWIAYLCAKLFWSDLNAIVIADDILKHGMAACSQTSIVLAAAFQKIGVSYRKIGLKGHFVLEASINNQWYLFDPNLEPDFPNGRKSIAVLTKTNELYASYVHSKTQHDLKTIFSKIEYGKPNAILAPRAQLFHYASFFLSILIPFALTLLAVVDILKRKRRVLKTRARRTIRKASRPKKDGTITTIREATVYKE